MLVARDVISQYDTQHYKARLCIYHSDDVTQVCDIIRNMPVVLSLVNGYTNSTSCQDTHKYRVVTLLINS